MVVALALTSVAPVAASLDASAASSRQAASQQRQFRFLDYNIEKKGYGAGFGNVAEPGLALNWALQVAHNQAVMGLTLQEVCPDQLERLKREHPQWTIASTPIQIPPAWTCGSDPDTGAHYVYDVAIWTGGSTGRVTSIPFAPTIGATAYGTSLTCVGWVAYSTPIDLCSTHLPATGSTVAETAKIRAMTGRLIDAGHFVVLGGDFNAQPSDVTLNSVYNKGPGTGRFREIGDLSRRRVCRCGAPTTQSSSGAARRKIDYLFVSSNRVGVQNRRKLLIVTRPARSRPESYSDHFLLYGQVWARTNA